MRKGKFFQLTFILISFVLVDSVLLKRIGYDGVRPDFVLVALIFMAHSMGSIKSVISGFLSGLAMDVITLSPFGFYGIIYATIGYLFGKTKNKLFLDPVFFPLVFTLAASIIKTVVSLMLVSIFLPEKLSLIFTPSLLIETLLSMVLAPFLFGLLKLTGMLKNHNREGF